MYLDPECTQILLGVELLTLTALLINEETVEASGDRPCLGRTGVRNFVGRAWPHAVIAYVVSWADKRMLVQAIPEFGDGIGSTADRDTLPNPEVAISGAMKVYTNNPGRATVEVWMQNDGSEVRNNA